MYIYDICAYATCGTDKLIYGTLMLLVHISVVAYVKLELMRHPNPKVQAVLVFAPSRMCS